MNIYMHLMRFFVNATNCAVNVTVSEHSSP